VAGLRLALNLFAQFLRTVIVRKPIPPLGKSQHRLLSSGAFDFIGQQKAYSRFPPTILRVQESLPRRVLANRIAQDAKWFLQSHQTKVLTSSICRRKANTANAVPSLAMARTPIGGLLERGCPDAASRLARLAFLRLIRPVGDRLPGPDHGGAEVGLASKTNRDGAAITVVLATKSIKSNDLARCL
jgi:hypothetical protein